MSPGKTSTEALLERRVEYISPPAVVSMSDCWFNLARTDHFWVRRRFRVLRSLAGDLLHKAGEIAEVGCGHGLLQRQIEDAFGREVTGFDLNENGLKHSVSRTSRICCYDICQRDSQFRQRFDLIFLFDVLEHITDEDSFIQAILFHLAPGGRIVITVPAGEWAFSSYDRVAGHVRRYSSESLSRTVRRNGLRVERWSYWGLPLVPILLVRKMLLGTAERDEEQTCREGFDSRSGPLNEILGFISSCEFIPQRLLGTSVMSVVQRLS